MFLTYIFSFCWKGYSETLMAYGTVRLNVSYFAIYDAFRKTCDTRKNLKTYKIDIQKRFVGKRKLKTYKIAIQKIFRKKKT